MEREDCQYPGPAQADPQPKVWPHLLHLPSLLEGSPPHERGVFRHKGLHVVKHQHRVCRQSVLVDESRPNRNIPNTVSAVFGLEMRLVLTSTGARQNHSSLMDSSLDTHIHMHERKHTYTA